MANLVTMAGRGKRFSQEGYLLPKPLLPIDGQPMIYKVIDCLPPSDKWIFVVRQEHIDEYFIDEAIRKKIPDAVVVVDKDLLGGASIFCAEEHLKENEEVLIAGCDMGFVFNDQQYCNLRGREDVDCILWTFTRDERISQNPTSWGYAILEEDGQTVKGMSVKTPISATPFEDHVVAATFWIRSKKVLYEAIRLMIQEGIKTNNEYYLDNLPLPLNKLGRKSVIFDVDLLIGWGTPAEFHSFEKITYFFRQNKLSALFSDRGQQDLWRQYFETTA